MIERGKKRLFCIIIPVNPDGCATRETRGRMDEILNKVNSRAAAFLGGLNGATKVMEILGYQS
jgi:hypothetical protein